VLRLDDKWVWDSWIADTGSEYHLFVLQAPRSLGDPDLRHLNATVGHAVSTDLTNWTLLPDALWPGPSGAWDDVATWTGPIVRHEGLWYMLYTGASSQDDALVQRIGLATSPDLLTWTKHPANPLIEADPRWYELLDRTVWHDQAWRDPWVFLDPAGDGYHALITARAATWPSDSRGVIAHARSIDLVEWQVQPPLTEPGGFGNMEVPQVEEIDGTAVLVFSCADVHLGHNRRARQSAPATGTYLCRGSTILGPFDVKHDTQFLDEVYSGRLVRARDGRWVLLGFVDIGTDGTFVGAVSDPIPLDALLA
jgi:beta-fructofuranosidase